MAKGGTMKLGKLNKFAWTMKYCDTCSDLFIWERYREWERSVGIYCIKMRKCKECVKAAETVEEKIERLKEYKNERFSKTMCG